MRPCAQCGEPFDPPNGNSKICSKRCENVRREERRKRKRPCSVCGLPSSSKAATPMCNPCRRLKPTYRPANMRARGMTHTWTCVGCGLVSERLAIKGQRPRWCDICRPLRPNHYLRRLAPLVRLGIYERDGWTCWLCEEPVDQALIGTHSMWRPSLDHAVPRAAGGTDDPSNLRLAHNWCNSARSDGLTYRPEDFRAS